ncbi:hypothetical protein LINGRAHAP2_LOCUS19391 [Linum grandiflorum]
MMLTPKIQKYRFFFTGDIPANFSPVAFRRQRSLNVTVVETHILESDILVRLLLHRIQRPVLLRIPPVNLRRRKARREIGTLDGGTSVEAEILEVGHKGSVAPVDFPHPFSVPQAGDHRHRLRRRDLMLVPEDGVVVEIGGWVEPEVNVLLSASDAVDEHVRLHTDRTPVVWPAEHLEV